MKRNDLLPHLSVSKSPRHYPLKRNEDGLSARQQCFMFFGQGKLPAEVASLVDISKRTARRYYADWKKQPQIDQLITNAMRRWLKDRDFSAEVIEMLSEQLEMPREEVIARLHKPWAIKNLLQGKLPNYRKDRLFSEQEARLKAALELIYFIESFGAPLKEISQLIERVFKEAMECRDSINSSKTLSHGIPG